MFSKDFFRGKKILITGHTGFKGTWLSIMLEALGAELYGFALPESENTLFFSDSHVNFCECKYGMVQNYDSVFSFTNKICPDIIIHLASHSTIDKTGELSEYIFESNIKGVINLYESIRNIEKKPHAVLTVTSDKCYLNMESNTPYTEDSPLGAQDTYSTSKACQELITDCYRKSFFSVNKLNIPIATARASNVIGGGDNNTSRLFPYLLNCFISGKEANIRNPYAIRPWQNVLDVLGGYLTLIEKMYRSGRADSPYASAFNFGPKEDGFATVKSAADYLSEEFIGSSYNVIDTGNSVIETNILKLDSKKSEKLLEWKPLYSFRETLSMTAEFAKKLIETDHGTAAREMISKYLDVVAREEEL